MKSDRWYLSGLKFYFGKHDRKTLSKHNSKTSFLPGFSSGDKICYNEISVVMLIFLLFWAKILGRKTFRGHPCSSVEESQKRNSMDATNAHRYSLADAKEGSAIHA